MLECLDTLLPNILNESICLSNVAYSGIWKYLFKKRRISSVLASPHKWLFVNKRALYILIVEAHELIITKVHNQFRTKNQDKGIWVGPQRIPAKCSLEHVLVFLLRIWAVLAMELIRVVFCLDEKCCTHLQREKRKWNHWTACRH
jgi:hypothetical protein